MRAPACKLELGTGGGAGMHIYNQLESTFAFLRFLVDSPTSAVREDNEGRRDGGDAREGGAAGGAPRGLSGGCRAVESGAEGAGCGSEARRGGAGRGSRGSERGAIPLQFPPPV
eukprot:COSAG02_NODE_4136_length_5728_cov_5.776692_1_plen_114_part_00